MPSKNNSNTDNYMVEAKLLAIIISPVQLWQLLNKHVLDIQNTLFAELSVKDFFCSPGFAKCDILRKLEKC